MVGKGDGRQKELCRKHSKGLSRSRLQMLRRALITSQPFRDTLDSRLKTPGFRNSLVTASRVRDRAESVILRRSRLMLRHRQLWCQSAGRSETSVMCHPFSRCEASSFLRALDAASLTC